MSTAHTSIGPLALGLLLLSAPVGAQQEPTEGEAEATTSPHGYQGVIPGTEQPPAVDVKPGGGATEITWPGFQMRPDGSSRVFVQGTGPLGTQMHVTAERVTITLGAAKLAIGTNGLPLETRFFNTPVKRAFVTIAKGVAYLVLDLRTPVRPQVSAERAKTGFHFVYVDFPAGQYLDNAPAAPAAAAPAQPQTVAAPAAPPTVRAPATLDGDVKASGGAGSSAHGEVKASAGGGKASAGGKGKIKLGL